MSNFLAVATVTAAIRARVLDAVQAGMDGRDVRVTTLRPGAPHEPRDVPRVNIYLLRILPSAGLRNIDLPMRGADGALVQRPTLAIDLQYVLTFTGDETRLEPQRLLALTVASLHAQPLLARPFLERVLRASMQDDDLYAFLRDADLPAQPEVVRLTPFSLDTEQLSKLWSVLLQTPYQLSVVYDAGPVLLDGPGPVRVPPVVTDPHVGVSGARPGAA